MSNLNDRVNCSKCNRITVNVFKYCQNCGVENVIESITTLSGTSFNNLDYNIITVICQYIHSKFKPLLNYYPIDEEDNYSIEQYNLENASLNLLFVLNKHYRSYKAKNYFYYLNKEYSLKYYKDENHFSLKINIDNPGKLILS